jgi:putative hydrolase of the HAD superfamily
MDDFERVLAGARLSASRAALDAGYEASATYLSRVWSDHRDVPVERHVLSILAAADPDLPRRVSAATMTELVDAYSRPALLVPPAVDPGALGALETLVARGYALGVVSNTMRTPGVTLRQLLERYGILGFFRHTTFSDEVGIRKPAPEIFTLALRALGAEVGAAVHVGDDAILDVEGARAAGMRVIQVRSTPGRPPAGQRPDAVITSLKDLPAAVERLDGR